MPGVEAASSAHPLRAIERAVGVIALAVLCGVLLGAAGAEPAQRRSVADAGFGAPAARADDDLRGVALARLQQVERELAELGDHPWAGHYRTSGRVAGQLTMAPGAGFTLYTGAQRGACSGWRAVGRVLELEGGELRLVVELACSVARADDEVWWWTTETLHLVPWGELLYVIPTSALERFYVSVNDGYSRPTHLFARAGRSRSELEFARPSGAPRILAGYEHLVLVAPVYATLEGPLRWVPQPGSPPGPGRLFDAVYTVDLGEREGLVVGMHLFVEGKHPLAGKRGSITYVGPETALLALRGLREDRRALAENAVGSPVSSLHPKAPRR